MSHLEFWWPLSCNFYQCDFISRKILTFQYLIDNLSTKYFFRKFIWFSQASHSSNIQLPPCPFVKPPTHFGLWLWPPEHWAPPHLTLYTIPLYPISSSSSVLGLIIIIMPPHTSNNFCGGWTSGEWRAINGYFSTIRRSCLSEYCLIIGFNVYRCASFTGLVLKVTGIE